MPQNLVAGPRREFDRDHHPAVAEVYRQRVVALQEALHDPSSRDEAFDLIRSLIEKIRLVPDKGKLRIEIKGELAGILELCREACWLLCSPEVST